jgi:hypothetical protein
MKPIIILPPNEMSDHNINMLRENGLCVVVAKHPAAVKFVDPLPAVSSRTQIEDAAIRLSRKLLSDQGTNYDYNTKAAFSRMYVQLLVAGTPLDPEPTQQEIEKRVFDETKLDELRKLARDEAKAERLEAKKAKQQPANDPS